jgi:hypothetical protein
MEEFEFDNKINTYDDQILFKKNEVQSIIEDGLSDNKAITK